MNNEKIKIELIKRHIYKSCFYWYKLMIKNKTNKYLSVVSDLEFIIEFIENLEIDFIDSIIKVIKDRINLNKNLMVASNHRNFMLTNQELNDIIYFIENLKE